MSSSDLLEIASVAIEATTQPGKWADVCERLTARTRSLFALVFEFDVASRSAPILHAPKRLAEMQEFLERFREGASQDDPRSYEALSLEPVGMFRTEAELLKVPGETELPSNGFRDGYFPLIGAVSRGAARLNDIGPQLDLVSLHLDVGTNEIPRQLREDIRLLSPIIGKALEAGRTVRALAQSYGALLDSFDRLECGAAICGPDGQILISNQSFRYLADDADAVSQRGGVATAVMPDQNTDLARLIRSATKPGSPARDLVVALRRRSQRLPIVVRAVPIRSMELRARSTLALLLFFDPADRSRLGADGLAAFRVLSPAELEVCDLLVKGWPTDAIAAQRNTSIETARGQIKAASAKLQCSSRLDIVRLALAVHSPMTSSHAANKETGKGS